MSVLFEKIKQKVDMGHVHMTPQFTPNMVGNAFETHAVSQATDNHEAFKALCEEVEEELYTIKELVAVLEDLVADQRDIFLKLQENLLEKGFLTKDEMIIK